MTALCAAQSEIHTRTEHQHFTVSAGVLFFHSKNIADINIHKKQPFAADKNLPLQVRCADLRQDFVKTSAKIRRHTGLAVSPSVSTADTSPTGGDHVCQGFLTQSAAKDCRKDVRWTCEDRF